MTKRQLGYIVLFASILATAGFFYFRGDLGPPTATMADAAVQPALGAPAAVAASVDEITAAGHIVPLRHAELSFKVGGRVAALLVSEGDTVSAGDALMRLEDAEALINLRKADAELARAAASLDAANVALQAAQQGVTAAQVEVTIAEAQLALLIADPAPEEIAAAESVVAASAAGVSQSQASRAAAIEVPLSAIRTAEAQVAAAVAAQRSLQIEYDQVIASSIGGPEEEQRRYALNAATAAVNAAQSILDELSQGVSPSQRAEADAAVAYAIAERDAAAARLNLLLVEVKPEEVAIYQGGIERARAAVDRAEVVVSEAETVISRARADLLEAEAGRDAAQASLDALTLRAPFDGVVADLSAEASSVVSAGDTVLTMADFGAWLVETIDLTELDVVAVSVGDTVNVRVDALGGSLLHGQIVWIDAVPTVVGTTVSYAATIRLDDGNGQPLRWGMTVFVDVIAGS